MTTAVDESEESEESEESGPGAGRSGRPASGPKHRKPAGETWRRLPRLPGRRPSWLPRVPAGWSLLGYLVVALAIYAKMLPDPAGRTLKKGTDDPAQSMWFLAYLPHAIWHGANLFSTDFIHYPDGINLMWNAYAVLLSVVAAPITLTLGPVVAYNVLLVVGTAAVAWTARLWLGRHVGNPVAAWIGGAMVGFSPYAMGQGSVHISLAVVPFVPLMLMALEDLLWRHPRSDRRTGILLGLATAGQALILEETVLLAAIGIGVAVIISAIMRPRRTGRALLGALPGLGWAIPVFAVIAGYPLYRQLVGNNRLGGVTAPWWSAQPRDWIFPTERQLLNRGPEASYWLNRRIGSWEAGGYLGILLLIAVVVVAVCLWRKRYDVRVAAIVVPVTMVLGLGPRLRLGIHYHGPAILPWRAVQAIPTLNFVIPARISMVTDIAVALVVAVAIDLAWKGLRGPLRATALAGLAVALVPIIPSLQQVGQPIGVPAYFRSEAARQIPWGSTTMILPLGLPPAQQWSMLWSAEAGARFRDIGGAAKRPPTGNAKAATPFPLSNPLTNWAAAVSHGGHPSPTDSARAKEWMKTNRIQYVLLADDYAWPTAAAQVSDLVGAMPAQHTGGVMVWKVDMTTADR